MEGLSEIISSAYKFHKPLYFLEYMFYHLPAM